MNIQGLIERYEKFKDSKKKMTSVDLVLKDLRSLDEPEPLPFKLKDVVGRIRGFDPTTQTRWLNDILKELGDDYGLMKYRSGYEQGKIEGAWVGNQLKDADKIRQELNQVKVPPFVADVIEGAREQNVELEDAFEYVWEVATGELREWFRKLENRNNFARAWLDGYEVEEEKRYLVRIKGVEEDNAFLNYYVPRNEWFMDSACDMGDIRAFHTRKELEEAGFGWVFSCEGIEIEEVE